ncbi:MAG: hypothetical protein Ct9H300mP14_02220 [Gammaproteobacteria bacterium]|nr:MAG: hypothetical protein Ct9H300mP14_02220 [Gammaproteobacteria bacterium]
MPGPDWGLAICPRKPSIFRRLTVEQNILAVLEALPDLSAEQRLKRADAMLSEFGIAHKRDAKGYSLPVANAGASKSHGQLPCSLLLCCWTNLSQV